MRHTLLIFEPDPPIDKPNYGLQKRSDGPTGSAATGLVLLASVIYVLLTIVALGFGISAGGDSWGEVWPDWHLVATAPYVGMVALAFIGNMTHAMRGASMEKHAAWDTFFKLSKDAQAELGGKKTFLKSLDTMSDKECSKIRHKLQIVIKEEKAAAEVERKMRSQAPHLHRELDSLISQKAQFRKSMEELS